MSRGNAVISNFSPSADCASTLACLRDLGVSIDRKDRAVELRGVGKRGFSAPAVQLDCGNSGTTMRLLAGVLGGQPFNSVLTGDESLCKRPMGRVIEPLRTMGCTVKSADGLAPLAISGRSPLSSATITPAAASAQIKSCVLLAGLNADGRTTVVEAMPTRDHTERMLRYLGVDVEELHDSGVTLISVSGDATLRARDIVVPGDISAAAFFIAAAAALPGSDIQMRSVGLNGSRRAVLDVLMRFGARIELTAEREVCNEPVADIRVAGGLQSSGSHRIDGGLIPNLIDEIPILAVLGTRLAGGLEVRDAAELRIKESDRIAAIVENLRRMGASVEEFPDGLRVERSELSGAAVDSFGDHRIAMAFGVAALFASSASTIDGADCCSVSFPGFFDVLSAAAVRARPRIS